MLLQLRIDASAFAPFCERAFKALYTLANSNRSVPLSASRARKRRMDSFAFRKDAPFLHLP